MFTPEAQILSCFTLRIAVSETNVQGQRKSECTEWPQTELEHIIVKSTPYTIPTPEAQILSVSLYD